MIRMLASAGGIAGAVALSQFPEFSQQYMQRLSGAVDELRVIVSAFDVTATATGVSRDEALAELSGSAFQSGLRDTLAGQIDRYERLNADYEALRGTEPLVRLTQAWRMRDADLVQRTWDDFRPAVPVTTDGFITAGIGFVAGWLLVMGLLAGLWRLIRGRRRSAA